MGTETSGVNVIVTGGTWVKGQQADVQALGEEPWALQQEE